MHTSCPFCNIRDRSPSENRTIRSIGFYWRKSDGRSIRRFWCKLCKRGFSNATNHPCFGQNKRNKNRIVRNLLAGGMSQREAARALKLNRKTIVRKFLFWAKAAEQSLNLANLKHEPCSEVEFDDLETFEHTKCKPLSVTLFVEANTRRILDFEVAKMPAKGRLAAISRKKYGPRIDERAQARERLFPRLKKHIQSCAIIRSDSNPHYLDSVARHFPEAQHILVKGQRGVSTAQGELKKIKFDPIFSLNHTCAMLRAHLSRLMRKTWNTTKRPDRLRAHLFLYSQVHNERLFFNKIQSVKSN